jgi:hypothetical protein
VIAKLGAPRKLSSLQLPGKESAFAINNCDGSHWALTHNGTCAFMAIMLYFLR